MRIAVGRSSFWFAAAIVAMAVPVLLNPMPPLLDYPNHLARIWLIEGGIGDHFLSRIYAIDWRGAATNILIDIMAAAACGIVPAGVLGPALLITSLLAPGLGIAVLARTVHGRLTPWHLLCFLLGWTQVFVLGFINFQIALGLAMLAAAGDEKLRRSGRSALALSAYRLACGTSLIVAHAFGLLFYAVLGAGLAVGPTWPVTRQAKIRAAKRILLPGLPLLAVMICFWLLAAHPADHRPGAEAIEWQSRWIVGSPAVLFEPLRTYRSVADIPFMAALMLIPIVAAVRKRLAAHIGLVAGGIVLMAGALVMPRHMAGTALLELRLPTMMWFVFAAALLPDPDTTVAGRRFGFGAALVLVVLRSALFGAVWLHRKGDTEAVMRALAGVPRHARILPLVQSPGRRDFRELPWGRTVGHHLTMWHLPTLAIVEKQAFVPTLFASPGKQIVRVRAPFDRIAVTEGAIASVDKLGVPLGEGDRREFGYIEQWPCFDYVLVLNADVPNAAGPMRRFDQISLAADEGFAKLYRIDHGNGATRCAIAGL